MPEGRALEPPWFERWMLQELADRPLHAGGAQKAAAELVAVRPVEDPAPLSHRTVQVHLNGLLPPGDRQLLPLPIVAWVRVCDVLC